MSSSAITKRAIASAFEELLEVTPLEQITVSAIAERTGINRQTFYYHFHDIHELIIWNDLDLVTRFYTVGLVGTVYTWISDGMHEAPERLTERILLMLDGTLEGSLRRLSRNPDGKTPNSSCELHG